MNGGSDRLMNRTVRAPGRFLLAARAELLLQRCDLVFTRALQDLCTAICLGPGRFHQPRRTREGAF